MRKAYSVADIRAAESAAMGDAGGDALMQRAASGLAHIVAREMSRRELDRSVLLVVGPGNNGGDALWAGVRLRQRGMAVAAWRPLGTAHADGWAAFQAAGGRAVDASTAMALLQRCGAVVDGFVGIGGRTGLPDDVALLAEAAAALGVLVVAVDVPSGLDADRPGAAVSFAADLTVTFGGLKACHLLAPASQRCGRVEFVDIGLELGAPRLLAWDEAQLVRVWPWPNATSDKYSRGVVGLETGSALYSGAGVLGALGAVYAGAGMVRSLQAAPVAAAVREALPNIVVGDGRVQAMVVGSGWGERADGREVVRQALDRGVGVVVDADALRCLPSGQALDPGRTVLTPHAGELARLLDVERTEVTADPVAAVRHAAEHTGAAVLLKGASQLVAVPGGDVVQLAVPGPAWTAQAGSGDVLAGICGALLAAGLRAVDAGCAAASIQALAAARLGGPYPPQDVARAVPQVVGALAQAAARAREPIASR